MRYPSPQPPINSTPAHRRAATGICRRATTLLLASVITVTGVSALGAGVAGAEAPPPPPPGSSSGGSATAGYLHPLTPARILDTRTGVGASGAVGPGGSIELQVAGRGGVPEGAGAVVLNVTVTDPTASGFVTVHPSGSPRPTASNLNFRPGQTVPNLVVAKLGADGKVTLFNSHGSSHLIADVMGWYDDIFASFPALPEGGSRQRGIAPTRVLDTREQGGAIGAGQELELRVAGVNGIPADATAVALNVTVTGPTSAGFLTVYPAGSERPDASNLNFGPGQTVPNMVIAKVGADGNVRLFNSHGASHVIVDVTAYFEPAELLAGGELNAVDPARVLDTRDGLGAPAGKVGPGQTVTVQVTGQGGVPTMNVDSVVLNVTATDPTSAGFVTVFPAGSERPTASNLNVLPGQTVPNLVVAKVGVDGKVTLFNSHGSTHLIADVTGWFNADTAASGPPGLPFGVGESVEGGAPDPGRALSAADVDPSFAADQAAFWTGHDAQDALRAAEPTELLQRDSDRANSSDRLTEAGPDRDGRKYQIWRQGYAYPNYDNRIGRLVYFVPSKQAWGTCTATMVSRNLAVTAAHCVVNESGWNTNYAFFAGLQGTTAHGGIYTNVVNTIVPADSAGRVGYLNGLGFGADYAFVQFGPTNGRYPGDIVGSYQLIANPQVGWLLSYGYPAQGKYFNTYCRRATSQYDVACYLYYTWGRYGGYNQTAQGWYEIGWGSDMSGGSSGGPVFTYVNGRYYIASVNSNGYDEDTVNNFALNMWGPYFNQTMLDLFKTYSV